MIKLNIYRLMFYINSAINPILYNTMSSRYGRYVHSYVLMPIRILIDIKAMPILMRILHQVLHMLENHISFTFSRSIASLQCFIFLISVKRVILFNILDCQKDEIIRKICL
jgi:hypothetical protein